MASKVSAISRLREIPGLTGMRGLAALYVLMAHVQGVLSLPPVLINIQRSGASGVDFFFVLSGYLLITLYDRVDKKYFIRRVFRTFPLYYLSIPFFIIIGVMAFTPLNFFYLQEFFTQTWLGSRNIISPAWTLCLEEQFYFLVFPALLFLFRKGLKPWQLLIGSIVLSIVWGYYFESTQNNIYLVQFPKYLVDYSFGIFFAKTSSSLNRRFTIPIILGWIVAMIYVQPGNTWYAQPIFGMVYGLILWQMKESKIFNWRPVHYLGKISYPLYLFQEPVIFFLTYQGYWLLFATNYPVIDFVIICAITLSISVALHEFIERPLIQFGHRITATNVT